MFGIEWAVLGTRVGGFFKRLLKSPWLYVAIAIIGIGGGTYFLLNHWKNEAVTTAVSGANDKANVQTMGAKDHINTRSQDIDVKMDGLRQQTTKDYTNARATLNAAPQADRDSPAPRVIIDTLNDLDRLRATRDAPATDNASVPVG